MPSVTRTSRPRRSGSAGAPRDYPSEYAAITRGAALGMTRSLQWIRQAAVMRAAR